MKKNVLTILTLLLTLPAFASAKTEKTSDAPVKEHFQNHFKFYGFIRNYFVFDSRESVSGTSDLFYYLPKDVNMKDGIDVNDTPSFRFVALTSRAGVDVSGYQIGNVHFGAKLEADFYAGLSNSSNANVSNWFPGNSKISGTAQMRLRQAYATVTWKDLPMGKDQKASVGLKIGQAWHPMAADHPHLFSLEVGAPFGPFSRTPLVQMDANLGKSWVVSAAAIWQMQYQSTGPVGASAIYMKYGMTPEMYAAVAYKVNGFQIRAGVDMVSIKPRVLGTTAEGKTVKVSDRKTSVLGYVYAQYAYKKFAVKAKTTFGQGGEHMNLMSGYAKVGENLTDGSWEYASLRNSSSWLSLSYGKKWQGVLFLGYIKNLGLAEGVLDGPIAKGDVYFCGNGFSNLNQMYRINPQLIYNIGKMNVGLEYQWTGVQYGDYVGGNLNARALADENLHWVGNHRVNLMVKYNF
ncbi:MAG: hypothetical protein E7115_08585 [Bacteroidales bacterium]|nr:hypothetical protein [Bacteroidales bacterium]